MPVRNQQLSNYLENKLLGHWLGATVYTPPSNHYWRFYPAATPPSDGGGGTEFSGASYAPITVANNLTNYPAASGRAKANGTLQVLPDATAAYSAPIAFFGIWDASSGGNLLAWGELQDASGNAAYITIANTNTFKVEIGQLSFAFQGAISTYLANKLLDLAFGGVAFTPPTHIYFAQMSVANSENGGGTEFSSGGYVRGDLANNTTNFPAPTTGVILNGVDMALVAATGAQGTRVQWSCYDAATAGNLLWNLTPNTPKAVNTGDNETVPVGNFRWDMD